MNAFLQGAIGCVMTMVILASFAPEWTAPQLAKIIAIHAKAFQAEMAKP